MMVPEPTEAMVAAAGKVMRKAFPAPVAEIVQAAIAAAPPEWLRAAAEANRKAAGHDAYAFCIDGGFAGYQARCWDCDWTGPEHLRGGEEMGTDESRVHKVAAKQEARQHYLDSRALRGGEET